MEHEISETPQICQEENAPEEVLFTSEVTHDLAARKEVNKLYSMLQLSGIVRDVMVGIMLVVLFVYLCLIQHNYAFYARTYFVFVLCYWGAQLFNRFRERNGGATYKRMLANNGGKPIHNTITFTEDGFCVLNTFTEGASEYTYDQIVSVAQSRNFFLLYRNINQCTVVAKNTLTGGTAEEFLAFLNENCVNWPGVLRTTKRSTTVRAALIAMWIIFLLLAVGCLFMY